MALKGVFGLLPTFNLQKQQQSLPLKSPSLEVSRSPSPEDQDELQLPSAKRVRLKEAPPLALETEQRLLSVEVPLNLIKTPSVCLPELSSDQRRSAYSLRYIRTPPLVYPKLHYAGWVPPIPVSTESDAIFDLMEAWTKQNPQHVNDNGTDVEENDDVHFELTDFSVYRPKVEGYKTGWEKTTADFEMVPLHALNTWPRASQLLFDGILSVGAKRRFVQAVDFKVLSVEGYEDTTSHSILDIWLQTLRGKAKNIWCRLGKPSAEYARYHDAFCWIANFGKHFVEYLLDHPKAELRDFRSRFCHWLLQHHQESLEFQQWFGLYHKLDFRQVLVANFEYLWKEATDVRRELCKHPIWREFDHRALGAIRSQPLIEKKTIVTPFVKECFKHAYFSSVLEARESTSQKVITAQCQRKLAMGFPTMNISPQSSLSPPPGKNPETPFRQGCVVSVMRDEESVWKDGAEEWLALVRHIREDQEGEYLEVTWLYRPSDTTLGNMTYPFPNELFFSDHCNCGDKTFRLRDVKSVVVVKWFPKTIPTAEYFVRQTYNDEHSFVALKNSHFECNCGKDESTALELLQKKFKIQDTVLAVQGREHDERLEPFVITNFLEASSQVQVRRLCRANRDLGKIQARPNELVWTDHFLEISANAVRQPCSVRFYHATDITESKIPIPYNRDGQAGCFYITSRLLQRNGEELVQSIKSPFPGPMKIGFDPTEDLCQPYLASLSLFSGGGNFDRGLEEGGAIRTKWAVEWDQYGAHTFRANLQDSLSTEIFQGSVDDYLAQAISGSSSRYIAQIGKVNHIAGGSPCQGFSNMQPETLSLESIKNASKVASVAAFVDHYRPAYALLENVPAMTRKIGPNKDENVFSQMLCALVAMGYQVQQFLLDAWSYGSPQSRTRLFISISAPGCTPLSHPHLTHSHPERITNKALGTAINGERFGARRFDTTPFKFVTTTEATKHLPRLDDGQVLTCIPYPDHRESIHLRPIHRYMVSAIPTTPPSQGMVQAVRSGRFGQAIMDYVNAQHVLRTNDTSRSFQRVNPEGLFPTFTTKLTPHDGKAGYGVHWEEHRLLTVMEARIGQGYPDDEIIIGITSQQWKTIGNSVARPVALALGMRTREAWLQNSKEMVGDIVNACYVQDVIPPSPSVTSMENDKIMTEHQVRVSPQVVVCTKNAHYRSYFEDWTQDAASHGEAMQLAESDAESDGSNLDILYATRSIGDWPDEGMSASSGDSASHQHYSEYRWSALDGPWESI